MTIQMTPKAIEMAKAALKENTGDRDLFLRISVKGGGCSGFQYNLTFCDNVDEGDIVSDYDGLKVVVDGFTATQIPGTTIDYEESINGEGFKFINPTVKRTCGCGSSFS